jgi:hypothetical protein
MKKYFTVMMGCRGEIEQPEIMEIESIDSEIMRRMDELVVSLKGADYDESGIEDYVEEWWNIEMFSYGYDVCWGEEESCIYIDMNSEMFKKWGGDVDSDEEKVWDLLNMFWNGGEEE